MSFASFLDSCASGTSHLPVLRLCTMYALLVERAVAINVSMDKPFAHEKTDAKEGQCDGYDSNDDEK